MTHQSQLVERPPHRVPKGAGAACRLHLLPNSKTVTGLVLDLEPGGPQEVHGHPTSDGWQSVIGGDVSVTMFDSHGRYRTEWLSKRDVGDMPQGFGHSIGEQLQPEENPMRSVRRKRLGSGGAARTFLVTIAVLSMASDDPAQVTSPPSNQGRTGAGVRLASAPIQAQHKVAARSRGEFANPRELPRQGVYDLTLTCGDFFNPHGREDGVPGVFRLLCYNGLSCGPTIRARRGSTLRIRLKNDLAIDAPMVPPDPSKRVQPPYAKAESPHGLEVTNLHTHGLHVSPADPGDNVLRCVGPQQEHEFTFHIPADHPSGTFWYHPHNHGSVAYQLSNGLAGALIVEGTRDDGIPDLEDIEEIAAAKEQILVFQLYNFRTRRDPKNPLQPGEDAVGWIDASTIYNVRLDSIRCGDIKVPPEDQDPHPTVAYQVTAINGQINPTMTIAPGEMQRWRLIHGGWDQYRKLSVVDDGDRPTDDFRFAEIALDGLATGEANRKSFERSSIEIAPGQRSDVLIKAPTLPAGTRRVYHLKQFEVDPSTAAHRAGQDPMYLARIVVQGEPPTKPMSFPDPKAVARCRPFSDIKNSELSSSSRTFTFAGVDGRFTTAPFTTGFYTINDAAFHDQDPIRIPLDGAEEWALKANVGTGPHPFHIHVNPFQIVGYDGPNDRSQVGRWRDTLFIKEGETYRIRQRFLDFPGKTVFHCHILDHEDEGMMVPISISDGVQPLPPQEICKELRAPATKLTAKATPAPPLKLPDARGGLRSLEEFRRRNVILVFFQGIKCFHCSEQLRELVREARGQAGLETEIVAVSSRKIADPARSLEALGVTDVDRFHLLIDEGRHAFRDFGCYDDGPRHGLFLIDRHGLIRASYVGDTPFGDPGQVVRRARELVVSDRRAEVGRRGSP